MKNIRTTKANLDDSFTAFGPTISSRNKTRPEAKFQKVVTSKILSQMRKDSHNISKDPRSFLEGLVQGQSSPVQLNTDSFASFLTCYSKDSSTDHHQAALENLERKCRQTKNRTLLLNLGSNPAIRRITTSNSDNDRSSSTSSSKLSSLFRGTDSNQNIDVTHILQEHSTDLNEPTDQVDTILQYFLDEIRVANVESISAWIGKQTKLNDTDLPFGQLECGLKMPTKDLEQYTSPALIEFIRSATDQFFLLDAEYHAKLEELMGKVTENFSELQSADWDVKDAAILYHLMNMFQSDSNKTGSHFSSEKLCTEVAIRIFPLYTREQVIAQKYRLKVKRALEEKRESIIKDWIRDKEKLMKKINGAWEDIQHQQQRRNELESEKRLQKEKCHYWMTKLEEIRLENQKKIRTIDVLMKPLEEQQKQKQLLQEKQERSRRYKQKHLVDKFRQMKIESLEAFQQRREEMDAAEEKEKRLRLVKNQVRVDLRKEAFEMKRTAAKELARKQAQEEEERLANLEKTKEKVEIDYHPSNVLNDTHTSLVRCHEIQSLLNLHENDETVKFFRERYSFSAETLWKDTRVRLESKLREAGLIDNSYARHVLLAMQPQPKPHLKSNIKFEPTD
ncbi:hypothetical protein Ocin01_09415 [Orchesella cincta]|uniref:Coiled-coil domain-containing protein n=1 Tax=Orchesella cincta TaxID=48709 RepID=A0A1D2MW89_ORCCI|nr:hypothetical protein Ocin01_09415 [Orchesella cincta]